MKKNFINYTLYQLITFALPIILNAYVSRTLGVENIGMYNLSLSVITYFSILLKLGIDLYGSREVAYARNNKNTSVNKVFSGVFQIQLTMGIIVLLIFLLISHTLSDAMQIPYNLLIIQGIGIFAALLDISWLVIGLEKFNVIIVRNTLVKLISIVLVMTVIKSDSQINLYATIVVLTNVFAAVSIWIMMKKYIKIKFNILNYKYTKPIFILFLPIIATSLFTQLDTILVAHYSNFREVGLYASALSIIAIPKIVVSSFGSVVMPHMSKQAGSITKEKETNIVVESITYWFIFGAFIVTFTLFNATYIVNFMYGKEFGKTTNLLMILVLMIPFYILGNILRTQVLIPKKNDKPYVVSILIAAIVNISGNVMLVPWLGATGGIIAVFLTETVICVVECIYTRKMTFWFELKKFFIKWLAVVLITILVLFLINIIEQKINVSFYIRFVLNNVAIIAILFVSFKKQINDFFDKVLKVNHRKVRNID
ncbi:oligosaccharide flippase family protein [Leuconostoc fallax]|uniref:oligosaccharide flippase family protein n=1 Tax=Leuconostoc fallax TaxID=1251 RepID=UPI002090CD44|nr:oligosaccharide flippase family protein [Leuconostoc fallax]